MSTVQELKQQLAAAEAEAAKQALAQQMAAAEALVGRAFYGVTQQHGQTGWYAWLYTKAKRSTWRPGEIEMDCRRVWCSIRTGQNNAEIQRHIDQNITYETRMMLDATEISKDRFKELWDLTGTLTKAFMAKGQEVMPRVVVEPREEELSGHVGDELVPLDVPVIQLTPGDANYLPKSFYIQGDQYLLTPKSRTMGLQRIRDEECQLMRGSQFFESCDMRYVNGQQERFSRLRGLLNG